MILLETLGVPFLSCLVLVAVLSYLGLHVLRREIIFIDIALAQLAAVGAIVAHLAVGAHGGSAAGQLAAFGLVVVAAAFYAVVRRRITQLPLEAVIGVSYAIAAAGALFLLGVGTGGHVHVQHMLAGSILWATWRDVLVCAGAFGVIGGLFRIFRGPLTRISEDYEGAVRAGVRVVWWDFLFYTLCGAVIALAVGIGGIVVVFAFLIIPATVSAVLASGWGVRLVAAWATGAIASVLGLLFAYRLDFSVGPSVAMFLGVELVLVGAYGLRRTRAVGGAGAGILAAAFAVLRVLGGGPSTSRPSLAGEGELRPAPCVEHADPVKVAEDFSADVRRATDAEKLAQRFAEAPDDLLRQDLVLRALALDRGTGVRLAVRFLRADPPPFNRQEVVGKLEELADRPLAFDIMEPFDSPANRKARDALAEAFGLDGGKEGR